MIVVENHHLPENCESDKQQSLAITSAAGGSSSTSSKIVEETKFNNAEGTWGRR